METETLEFQISQYADGTLPAAESIALEELLSRDPDARLLLAEYRRLDTRLARHLPLPDVKWDRLAVHLTSAVAESDAAPAVAGRITPAGAATWSWRSQLAIAASVVIAIGGAVVMLKTQQPGLPPSVQPTATAMAMVVGPQAEPASGAVVEEITVGPSKALAARGDSSRYAEGVVARPSSVVIAGEMKSMTDGESFIH